MTHLVRGSRVSGASRASCRRHRSSSREHLRRGSAAHVSCAAHHFGVPAEAKLRSAACPGPERPSEREKTLIRLNARVHEHQVIRWTWAPPGAQHLRRPTAGTVLRRGSDAPGMGVPNRGTASRRSQLVPELAPQLSRPTCSRRRRPTRLDRVGTPNRRRRSSAPRRTSVLRRRGFEHDRARNWSP